MPLVNCQSIDDSIIWVHMFLLYSVGLTASILRMCFHALGANPNGLLDLVPASLMLLYSQLQSVHSIYTGIFLLPVTHQGHSHQRVCLCWSFSLQWFSTPRASQCPLVLEQGWFCPPGEYLAESGDIFDDLEVGSATGGLWQRPRMLLDTLQYTGWFPSTQNCPVQ